MNTNETRFLKWWGLAFVASITLVVAFNAIIDPYSLLNMPRFPGLNARKPAVDTEQRLMKAYDVFRERPRTLILGSSRAALGIDALSAAWTNHERPVYNLAFGEGSPYMAYRYLQHVISRQSVSMVVMGLELEYFLRGFHDQDYEFESHLSVERDGTPRWNSWIHLRDQGLGLASLGAFTDSISTMSANWLKDSSDMRSGNWHWTDLPQRLSAWGAHAQFTMTDILAAPLYGRRELATATMDTVRNILDLCESRHIRIIIFISPAHADELELMHLTGMWPVFEQWESELAALVALHGKMGNRDLPVLWDFTGYDSFTEESVLRRRWSLKWFMEPAHYSREMGDVIIRRLLNRDDSNFGAVVTSENVQSHLQELRREREAYRLQHPVDAVRVRELYELATVGRLSPTADLADLQ